VYQDLSKYFNNAAYPGLKKAFSQEYLEANKFFGKTIAVPITNTFTDLPGIYYRKDLAQKYGITINTIDDLKAYWKALQTNEPGITPIGSKASSLSAVTDYTRDRDGHIYNVTGLPSGIEVGISADGKKVLGVTANSEPASAFANYPSPWNKANTTTWELMKDVVGYVNKDSLVTKEVNPLFFAGKIGTISSTITNFSNFQSQLVKNVPSAQLGFWAGSDNVRAMKQGAVVATYQAWNFLCVPTNSKNADRAMKFLDWVMTNQQNNDLFSFGIEGTNWQSVGDKAYKLPAGVDPANNYTFPGFELTWNPNYTRLPDGLPSEVQKLFQYEFDPSTYTKSMLAGFTFDSTNVKSEIAKLTGIDTKYDPALNVGQNDGVSNVLAKKYAEVKDAGLDKVKVEVQKQVQAFLDSKK
jgi:putative aldouronate transport system substrate-binding protein